MKYRISVKYLNYQGSPRNIHDDGETSATDRQEARGEVKQKVLLLVKDGIIYDYDDGSGGSYMPPHRILEITWDVFNE